MHHLPPRRALLIATTWWSGPAKLAIALARHGWELETVCPANHPFAFISSIRRSYPYRVLDPLGSLLQAVLRSTPDVVVPCDDGAVRQLYDLYRTRPELRELIERSLGDSEGFATLSSRAKVAARVEELGIRAPRTVEIKDAGDLRAWFASGHSAGVLKSNGSFGGKGVCLTHSLAEAERALVRLRRPLNAVGGALRWMALRDPLSFADRGVEPAIVMQELISGQPANILFVCDAGKVLASVMVEVLITEGATGAALAVRVIRNAEMQEAAEKLAESLGLSGFHGLDFILEEGTGDAYLIEMNPRCTQLGHLVIDGQGDLAGYLRPGVGLPLADGVEQISDQVVVFYPQGLWSLPKPLPGDNTYVDVPWTEEALTRELVKSDWRERLWLGWLYYKLRPQRRVAVTWKSEVRRGSGEVAQVATQ